jgi:hypothetical protein
VSLLLLAVLAGLWHPNCFWFFCVTGIHALTRVPDITDVSPELTFPLVQPVQVSLLLLAFAVVNGILYD